MSSHSEPVSQPPLRRNPLTRLAALLLGTFGLICLTCCVGTWIVEQGSEIVTVSNPDEIQEIADEIISVDVPRDLVPTQGRAFHTMFDDSSSAIWKSKMGAVLLVGKISEPFDLLDSEFETSLEKVPLVAELDRQPYFHGSSANSIEVEINGQKIEFSIADMSMFGMPGLSEVSGVFPTRDGKTGVLYFRTDPEMGASEKLIENLIHSLK